MPYASAFATASEGSRSDVLHRYLDNGMEVYLAESRFAPLVNLQVWVKAGSIDESDAEAGVAHVLEHMLFKGTTRNPEPGGIAGVVEAAGGDMNAYTTFDHTVYYLTAPSEFAAKGTELLLDIVKDSLIDAGELSRELEVIREEIKRSRDNPSRVVSQNLFERLYAGTRYARPVIGFENVVEGFTRELVRGFYERWYVPNNMAFVAAGDFDKDELFARLRDLSRTFGPRSVPARERPALPANVRPQKGPALVSLVRGPYQEVRFQLGVRAPRLEDSELAQWEMFASVLGHGDSSRLARNVRDESQLCLGIDADVYAPRYPAGMFNVGFYGKAATASEAITRTLREIESLALFGPQPEEMMRVTSAVKAERVYARESVEGISRTAGLSLLTTSKLDFEENYLAGLSKVTAAQVQEVARKILAALSKGEYVISSALARDAREDWDEAALSAHVEAMFAGNGTSTSLAAAAGGLAVVANPSSALHREIVSPQNPDVKQWLYALPGGRNLHFNWRRNDRLPLVSLCITWRGGQALETRDTAGLGTFLSQMLTRGTKKQSYKSFVAELEDRASSISAFSSRDIFGIRMDSLEENAPRTLEMLLDALFRPAFEPEEFNRVLGETRDVLVAQKDSPGSRLSRLTGPMLYGDHPYANPSYGTEESLSGFNPQDIVDHWKRVLSGAGSFVVACAGKFDPETVITRVREEFHSFCIGHPHITEAADATGGKLLTPPFPHASEPRAGFEEFEREQAHISLAFRALTLDDTRRTALELAANILGGQGGRLFLDLRDKRSLAYSVGASQSPGLQAGVFSAYIGTGGPKAREAILGLKEHIERLARELVDDEELARSKASVLGGQAIDAQHLHTQASQLAMSDVYGLGFDNFLRFKDRVKAVTREDVRTVMADLLAHNPPVVAVVGPAGTWVPAHGDPLLAWDLTGSIDTATAAR